LDLRAYDYSTAPRSGYANESAVAADYQAVVAHLGDAHRRGRTVGRLWRTLDRIESRDFFPPAERRQAERVVSELATLVEEVG